jgi:hypothetical protein
MMSWEEHARKTIDKMHLFVSKKAGELETP